MQSDKTLKKEVTGRKTHTVRQRVQNLSYIKLILKSAMLSCLFTSVQAGTSLFWQAMLHLPLYCPTASSDADHRNKLSKTRGSHSTCRWQLLCLSKRWAGLNTRCSSFPKTTDTRFITAAITLDKYSPVYA